jgi:glycosyltransferase involved in cell wall biosynthesis
MISIIIPCYNIEQHVSQCIESVLAQTNSDFELLLINDGSSDSTLDICKEYAAKDNRIVVYSHANSGVSFTRNKGIDLAQGDYIMFIDGDDYVRPDILEQFVLQNKEDSWSMCGMFLVDGAHIEERENYKELVAKNPQKRIEYADLSTIITHHNLSTPCCRLYDKNILNQNIIRFRENISYQEDLIFNLEYCQHITSVLLLDYYGYYYVKHPMSSTARFHNKFDHVELLFDLLQKMPQNEESSTTIKKIILDTILKKMANIFHVTSKKTLVEKRNEIQEIFDSNYFQNVVDFIPKSSISSSYKFLLGTKNSSVMFLFLYLKFRLL